MSFSLVINRWYGDFPLPKSNMHTVYCVFWKVLFGIVLEKPFPGIGSAFSC
jgi:hypothetical protein